MTATRTNISSDLSSTPDCDGTFIFNKVSGESYKLSMNEGIVWDLICRFTDEESIVKMISSIFEMELTEAAEFKKECLMEWQEKGMMG